MFTIARGRKSQYINKLTKKDQNMLRAFRNCGYLNEGHLKGNLGLSDRRIQNFCRDGHLVRVEVFDKNIKSLVQVYCLSEKGKEFVQQQLNLSNFYRSVSVNHDLALAGKYFNATTDQQQNWITEKDWKDRFANEVARFESLKDYERSEELKRMWEEKALSLPDGGYVEEDCVVAIEIITNNYGQAEIQAKTLFAQAINAEYQPYKI